MFSMSDQVKLLADCRSNIWVGSIHKVHIIFLDEEFSDADKLISLLENQHHSHVVLYHQNSLDPNQELVSEIKMENSTKQVNALEDLDESLKCIITKQKIEVSCLCSLHKL